MNAEISIRHVEISIGQTVLFDYPAKLPHRFKGLLLNLTRCPQRDDLKMFHIIPLYPYRPILWALHLPKPCHTK